MIARASACLLAFALLAAPQQAPRLIQDLERLPYGPRHYVCYRAAAPVVVDGALTEAAWRAAPWTDVFVDIEGDLKPAPRFRTRAKMVWDDTDFYVAIDMEEPDLWATLTTHDSVIFNDNDVEVFVDADGDTHTYAELELNALNTAWDLMLVKPYRDGGPPVTAWEATGLRSAVALRGTLNHPGDCDDGWTVEIAIPWRALRETAPGKRPPRAGDQWRVNFSRVEWLTDQKDGRYLKRLDATTGRPVGPDNWVWSPQGVVDMHMPERWGLVQFSGRTSGLGTEPFVDDPDDAVKWALRRIYYRQRVYRARTGRYATSLDALDGPPVTPAGAGFTPDLQATRDTYRVSAAGVGRATVHLQDDGRVWIARDRQ